MIKGKLILNIICLSLLYGCAQINTQAEYSSSTTNGSDLSVPPGMVTPDTSSGYKIMSKNQDGYKLDLIKDMKIVQGGSQRWLLISNKNVNQIWPMMLAYLNQMGFTVKYKNQNLGIIQTDWATKNNNIPTNPSDGVREVFAWVGWSSMYSLNSQYMFNITLLQYENDTLVFVTDNQMNEVYPGCVPARNSTVEVSNKAITKWMPVEPNPQLELDFLVKFMAYAGFGDEANTKDNEQIKQRVASDLNQPALAKINNNQLIIMDQFDRAWWRTGLALERVGLGVVDKNRESGVYYVYRLTSQIDNPDPGFLARWMGKDKSNVKMPTAQYIIKLTPSADNTILVILPYAKENEVNFEKAQKKYLEDLLGQLK